MFNYFISWSSIFMLFCIQPVFANKVEPPELVNFNYTDLLSIRKSIRSGEKKYLGSYRHLLTVANQLLHKQPQKVTDGNMPPTKDPHDFYAIGKFSWRNPNTADGLPYVRGDGRFNEEAFGEQYDLTRFEETIGHINTLCLAWFYSGDERYAVKAKAFLNVWFLDRRSAMNPNMNCASALPGVYDGIPAGIIFTVVLIEMVDHVKLLGLSAIWDNASNDSLKKWFSDYLVWLETSDFGKKEKAAANNHGTWYSAQVAAYRLFVGDSTKMGELFERAKKQIGTQVADDGALPLEMKRVNSFHYFIYGLRAFATLARSLEISGYDLWSYKTDDNKTLALPYKYIIPYLIEDKIWKLGGTLEFDDPDILTLLQWAGKKYSIPDLQRAADHQVSLLTTDGIHKLYVQLTN